mmetsp:Transcript_2117/g.3383  ORF Transcript_2117/g.3383 Transcript_2117/m.3383 type:complete len:295 (+) Transcript_2117:369-1253(+)
MDADAVTGFTPAQQAPDSLDEVEAFQAFDPPSAAKSHEQEVSGEKGSAMPEQERPVSPMINSRDVGSTSRASAQEDNRMMFNDDDEIHERMPVGDTSVHQGNGQSSPAAHRPAPLQVDGLEDEGALPAATQLWAVPHSNSYKGGKGSKSRYGEDQEGSALSARRDDIGEELLGTRRGSFDSLNEEEGDEPEEHVPHRKKRARIIKRLILMGIAVVLLLVGLMTVAWIEVCRLPFCAVQCVVIGLMHLRWEENSVLATGPNRIPRMLSQLILTSVPFALGALLIYLEAFTSDDTD